MKHIKYLYISLIMILFSTQILWGKNFKTEKLLINDGYSWTLYAVEPPKDVENSTYIDYWSNYHLSFRYANNYSYINHNLLVLEIYDSSCKTVEKCNWKVIDNGTYLYLYDVNFSNKIFIESITNEEIILIEQTSRGTKIRYKYRNSKYINNKPLTEEEIDKFMEEFENAYEDFINNKNN